MAKEAVGRTGHPITSLSLDQRPAARARRPHYLLSQSPLVIHVVRDEETVCAMFATLGALPRLPDQKFLWYRIEIRNFLFLAVEKNEVVEFDMSDIIKSKDFPNVGRRTNLMGIGRSMRGIF